MTAKAQLGDHEHLRRRPDRNRRHRPGASIEPTPGCGDVEGRVMTISPASPKSSWPLVRARAIVVPLGLLRPRQRRPPLASTPPWIQGFPCRGSVPDRTWTLSARCFRSLSSGEWAGRCVGSTGRRAESALTLVGFKPTESRFCQRLARTGTAERTREIPSERQLENRFRRWGNITNARHEGDGALA